MSPSKFEILLESVWKSLSCWLEETLKRVRRYGGKFLPYAVAAGVLCAIKEEKSFPPPRNSYVTEGNQLRKRTREIMAIGQRIRIEEDRLDLLRRRVREMGRTTRRAPQYADELIQFLDKNHGEALRVLEADELEKLADILLQKLVWTIDEVFLKSIAQPLKIRDKPISLVEALGDFLKKARERKVGGAAAQHLVGAKLQLRYPELDIPTRSYTAADKQVGMPGDYQVGDAAFHVTISPGESLVQRCKENVDREVEPWVLVPKDRVKDAEKLLSQAGLDKHCVIVAIEIFVGQNLEEIAGFTVEDVRSIIKRLINEYNRRIDEAEGGDPRLRLTLEWS